MTVDLRTLHFLKTKLGKLLLVSPESIATDVFKARIFLQVYVQLSTLQNAYDEL